MRKLLAIPLWPLIALTLTEAQVIAVAALIWGKPQ